jgi:hypothetical protein
VTDRPIPFSAPMIVALLAGRKTQTRRVLKMQPPKWATFCQQLQTLYVGRGWAPSGLWQWCEPETTPPRRLRRWPVHETGPMEGIDYGLRPPYAVGDRLWVREDHWLYGRWAPVEGAKTKGGGQKWAFEPLSDMALFERPYASRNGLRKSDPAPGWYKRLGRFMPRALSRLTLIVEDVRVERLQSISEADAMAEGAFKGKASGRVFNNVTEMRLGGPQWASARDWYADLWDAINGDGAWAANPWVVAVSFRVVRANIDDKRLLAGWVAP